MHDDQLREQFTRWAQPLRAARPPALPVLRRRARRRTARKAAVSGLAVMGTVAAIALSGFPWAGRARLRRSRRVVCRRMRWHLSTALVARLLP
jgi:hypothetical protein